MRKQFNKILLLGFFVPCLPLSAQKEFNALDHILQKRPKPDSIPSEKWYDHMFLSAGAGIEGLVNDVPLAPGRTRIGMNGAIYLGKWFNATSGMRIGLQVGIPQHQIQMENHSRRYYIHGGITADYMMNLSNYLYGYNPERIFNFTPFAGVGAHFSAFNPKYHDFSGSLRVGFQASVKITQGLDFFVEPTMRVYSDGFNLQKNWRQYDVVPTVMAGLTYTMVPRSLRKDVTPFYNDGLFDNLFFSAGAGACMILNGSTMNRLFYNHVGPQFFVGMGNWFTPVSAARVSITGSVYRKNSQYLTMFGGQLDYMMNMAALFEGYHADRVFQLYGVAGLNIAFPEKNKSLGKTANTLGFGIGLQGSFRLSSTTDIFVEPRLNVYPSKFAGGFTHSRFDAPATLTFGLTYRRPDNGSYNKGMFEENKLQDNLFISGGIGMNAPIAGFVKTLRMDAMQPMATASFGKWLTPVSGFRLNGQIGLIGEVQSRKNQFARTKAAGVGLDYLLNVSNFIGGYNPDRVVSLRASLGGNALFNSATDRFSDRGFEFGLVGGLQGTVRVSSNLELYLEPKLGLYTDGLYRGHFPPLKGDLLASLTGGLIYNIRSYDHVGSRSIFDSAGDGNWFCSLAGGVGTIVRSALGAWNMGPSVQVSFGKEFSPLSSWRTNFLYTGYPQYAKRKDPKQTHVALEGDYMIDVTTMFRGGYNPDAIFKLKGIIGVGLGMAEVKNQMKFTPGLHVALQPSFRLNDFLWLNLEPRADLISTFAHKKSTKFEAAVSGMAGLTWKFKL